METKLIVVSIFNVCIVSISIRFYNIIFFIKD